MLLLVAGGISAFAHVPWFRVAGWAFACYPMLMLASLYATWWAAWYALGHPPRSSLDDPRSISPLVNAPYFATGLLIFGLLPALLVHGVLAVIEFIRILYNGQEDLHRFTIRVGLPMLSWPFAYAWIMADPGGVVYWFMD